MTPEEQAENDETCEKLVFSVTNRILDIFEDHEHNGIPGEILLVSLIKLTRIYADRFNIPLGNLTKALETAASTGEVTTCTT